MITVDSPTMRLGFVHQQHIHRSHDIAKRLSGEGTNP